MKRLRRAIFIECYSRPIAAYRRLSRVGLHPSRRNQHSDQSSSGTEKENFDPAPTSLSTQRRPPCTSTMCLAMESPRPVPPASRGGAPSTAQKGPENVFLLGGGE